jgi:hypothetical protein
MASFVSGIYPLKYGSLIQENYHHHEPVDPEGIHSIWLHFGDKSFDCPSPTLIVDHGFKKGDAPQSTISILDTLQSKVSDLDF